MRINPVFLAVLPVVLAATGSAAKAQDKLADQLAACARIATDGARLQCYDAIAGAGPSVSPPSAPAPSRAPQGSAAPAPAATASAKTDFGAEQIDRPIASQTKEEGPTSLKAVIASARDNGAGLWQFRLTDGALWRMIERSSSFRPPVANEAVTIRKGSLGSYLMDVGRQAGVRVERVR